jgi:hypothetical protein
MLTPDIFTVVPLILMGFLVGILSGFFGFGGGFIITPFLFTYGLPMNVAVGTSIAQIMGTSVIATMRHRRLRNVDVKLGLITTAGAIGGVEIGAQLIEQLKRISPEMLDLSVSAVYIALLGGISALMSLEAWKARHGGGGEKARNGICRRIREARIPPMVSLSESGIEAISFWLVLFLGLVTGVTAGFVGAGGGFLQVPLLIYLLGCRTTVAVGTNLFGMLIASVYACFSHALKGNVDIFSAVYMLVGSAVGTQIGVSATRYVTEEKLRLAFGACVGSIAITVALELLSRTFQIPFLGSLSQAVLILAVLALSSFIMIQALHSHEGLTKRRSLLSRRGG